MRKVAQSLLFRFPTGSAVNERLLKYSNRFTAYSIHPIELKRSRMILDISPHNLTEPDFSISSHEVLWEARLLRSSNRFTAYSSYPIHLKLGRLILKHQSAQSLKAGFFDFPAGGAHLGMFKSIPSLQHSSDSAETW